jgi:enolase-phosphatase E1
MHQASDPTFDVVLLDIEGTTTPIDFVYQTLFPFARKRLQDYLAHNHSSEDVRKIIEQLRQENAWDVENKLHPPPLSDASAEAELASIIAYLHYLMDSDRKSTPLKSLQGLIWEEGYQAGELHSEVFADVPPAFIKWSSQRKTIAIFSSGSVLAQKLLFANTSSGDLSKFISAYFDTHIGKKREPESYRLISDALQHTPQQIIFFSDVVAELDAALAAGMQTGLCVRPDNTIQPACNHRTIHTFDELFH